MGREAFVWWPENMERLQQLFADGKSNDELAQEFGVTRKAVEMKLFRMGLRRAQKPAPEQAPVQELVAEIEAEQAPEPAESSQVREDLPPFIVLGLRDETHQLRMAAVVRACQAAHVSLPEEVAEYFQVPTHVYEVNVERAGRVALAVSWRCDGACRLRLSDIPEDVAELEIVAA